MNTIKQTVSLLILIIIMASTSLVSAQDAKTLFVNIPDSLCPLLTKVNREDCIDFINSKMKAQIDNRFSQKSEMTALGDDYVSLQLSPQTTWQMKLLPLNDSIKVVSIIETACAPACDSNISFYTTDWKSIPTPGLFTPPVMDDFIQTPDSASIYEFNEARRAADILLLKANFSKDNDNLTIQLTTPEYMSVEMVEKLEPFLNKEIVYKWVNGVFAK